MFERILLAVDGSETAEKAVPVAAELAKGFGGEVIVFHVREHELGRAGVIDLETSDEAIELVERIVRTLKDDGVSARQELTAGPYGKTARLILEAARREDASLIVVGSRGLSEIGGMLLGSVTHKVLHLAELPVLVVR